MREYDIFWNPTRVSANSFNEAAKKALTTEVTISGIGIIAEEAPTEE